MKLLRKCRPSYSWYKAPTSTKVPNWDLLFHWWFVTAYTCLYIIVNGVLLITFSSLTLRNLMWCRKICLFVNFIAVTKVQPQISDFFLKNLSLLVFSCCFLIFVKTQELIRWVRAAVAKKGLIRETIIIIDKGGYKLYFFDK